MLEDFAKAFAFFASNAKNGITLTDGFVSIALAKIGGIDLVPEDVEFGLHSSVVVPVSPSGVYEKVRSHFEEGNDWIERFEFESWYRYRALKIPDYDDPILRRIVRSRPSVRRGAAVIALLSELTAPVNTSFIHVVKMCNARFEPVFRDGNMDASIQLLADLIDPESTDEPYEIVRDWHLDGVEDYAKAVFGSYYGE